MDKHYQALISFLAQSGKPDVTPKKLTGSSAESVFLAEGKIFRVGEVDSITSTRSLYNDFLQALNRRHVFPEIYSCIHKNGLMIMEMENAGDNSLEEVLLSYDGTDQSLQRLIGINRQVLNLIETLFNSTVSKVFQDRSKCFSELLTALEINLRLADILDTKTVQAINKVKQNERVFLKDLSLSRIHKDLSVGNIMVGKDNRVSLIDPRYAIPNLQQGNVYGNLAFDLVGYLISLSRKEAELQRNNPEISFSILINEIEDFIERAIAEKKFNSEFAGLCRLVWYSVYVACRCEYCLAPERMWLYRMMGDNLNECCELLIGNLL